MILKKKKCYFEEELAKNRSKPKELWKVLKSLSSDKAKKSKIFPKRFYSELAGDVQQKLHPTNSLAKQPKTTTPRLNATNSWTLNCQTYLKRLLKRFCLVTIPVNGWNGPNSSEISEGRCRSLFL